MPADVVALGPAAGSVPGGARCGGGGKWPDGGGMIHGMWAIILLTPGMIGHRNFFPVWAVNSGGRVSAF